MATKAVQQFMLGTVLGSEGEARQTLAAMKEAGYDGIELCGFMIHPIGFAVKMLTKAAGMPVGKGGNLDWHKPVSYTHLDVYKRQVLTCIGISSFDKPETFQSIGKREHLKVKDMLCLLYTSCACWNNSSHR